ncbi:MAG: hypothetical protein ACYS9X_27130, partial [Planctomycetota bacterium]
MQRAASLAAACAACLCAWQGPGLAGPAPRSLGFEGAKWIWFSGDRGNPARSAPAGARFFRAAFDSPGAGARAEIVVTADNLFTLYVNGHRAGQNAPGPDSWRRPQRINLARFLGQGRNVLAVEATNTRAGPSGLVAKLVVTGRDAKPFVLVTDEKWKSSNKGDTSWEAPGVFDDSDWPPAKVAGAYGCAPWGRLARPVSQADVMFRGAERRLAAFDTGALREAIAALAEVDPAKAGGYARRLDELERALPAVREGIAAKDESVLRRLDEMIAFQKEVALWDPVFEAGVVFVRGFLPFTAHDRNNYIQNVKGTRAYFESDTPSPAALGRELYSLVPARPGGELRRLCDAKGGVIGSPSVSFDGRTVYFSMARAGKPYFHVYRVSPDGSGLRQITKGPFHDFDPVELPDGRIAFSSTRIGSREEYHAVFAFSIFACDPDGGNVRSITRHIVADREPTVTANGSLAFIRRDTSLERAKVETQIHETRL